MADATWNDLERDVRFLAEVGYGVPFKSVQIHGRQIDAYAQINSKFIVAIEITESKNINKLQDDINKLAHVRNINYSENFIFTECICILNSEPSPHRRKICEDNKIACYTIDEFKTHYLPYSEYRERRLSESFGSSNDIDNYNKNKKYIVVDLSSESGGKIKTSDIPNILINGNSIVLTGEYGTGKSKCIEHAFHSLSRNAWSLQKFCISIDLRKCWGLKNRFEILSRHLTELNLSRAYDAFARAMNDDRLIFLLDGFDEVNTQMWTDIPDQLKAIRSSALSGVRDMISSTKGGTIITGRDHYFNSRDELLSSLGLINKDKLLFLKTNDEFTLDEFRLFLDENEIQTEIPEWLPRKPLTCDFFVNTFGNTYSEQFDFALDSGQFWNLMINAICEREVEANPTLNASSIRSILTEISALTRTKLNNIGPISLSEIKQCFERAVGYAPIDQATALLQRTPGLGRTSSESDDRAFIDTYLLDGLRADDVLNHINGITNRGINENWVNPIGKNGLLNIVFQINSNSCENPIDFCKSNSRSRNSTLLLDVISAICLSNGSCIDFRGVKIDNGYCNTIILDQKEIKGLFLENCYINTVSVAGSRSADVLISNCEIELLEGISSESGIPRWINSCNIHDYSSMATSSRIRASQLTSPQKVLVSIIRKTFFQRGSGRQEDALVRGLGKLVRSNTQNKILNKIMSESMLTKGSGDDGIVYYPNRSLTKRASKILSELTLSKDPLWLFVTELRDLS